jgi:hypothetical protein
MQRALTITSAGYAEPQLASPASAVPAVGATGADSDTKLSVIIDSRPEIMMQPIAPIAPQTAATAVFPLPENAAVPHSEPIQVGAAFGQVYEA